MCPNIKELDLSWCDNLVEIENSVGRLESLRVGDLEGAIFSLRTKQVSFGRRGYPLCQKRALALFCLRISQVSPGRLGICQNLSFGNLIGLRELSLETVSKPRHLPGSIYNLQHIEKLDLGGSFIFPRDVEIDRQPLCNSLGGFSKYVFPSLKILTFMNFSNPLEVDFILNYCCPVTLEMLGICSCKKVTLPESISRCERLRFLFVPILEIPRLPRSLRYLDVSDASPLSLESIFHWVSLLNLNLFRNSLCYLPNTTWLDLLRCNLMNSLLACSFENW